MDLRAVYPGGATDMLFHVPRYDFNWQQLYAFGSAKTAPRGTKLEVVGVWDNSTSNRFNPDPRAEVHWGDQSWEEMLLGLVTMSIDPKTDVTKLFEAPKKIAWVSTSSSRWPLPDIRASMATRSCGASSPISRSPSTNRRRPFSVGTRPALVWGA